MAKTTESRDRNPDPITGEAGSHPVGTGVGAAAGGLAAGAALGAAAGPVGAAAGAVAGAVAGGYGGKAAAEAIDPTAEEAYWEKSYTSRPYYQKGTSYLDYQPAYQYGWESRRNSPDESFDDIEPELGREWEHRKAGSGLTWESAKNAVRDAWDRVTSAVTGTPNKPR
jgi:hypothetical protein